MKRWLWYLAAVVLVAALGWMPFHGTDVAKLQPVELLCVMADGGKVKVQTDTGESGQGAMLQEAVFDLKESTAGEIFLDTADFLLLSESALYLMDEMGAYLRPGCKVCLFTDAPETETAARFLRTHAPDKTLLDYRAGDCSLPRLIIQKERMYLVS